MYMDNAEEYWITARGVTRLDGARNKKKVWRPHVRTGDLSEANVLHWTTCDIVRTFQRPQQSFCALIVIRRPGIVPLLPPVDTPLITARSDAPQQTMVLSSHQRLMGTFDFRGDTFSLRPNFCATVRILLKQLAQTCQEVFPEFFRILPNFCPYLVRL